MTEKISLAKETKQILQENGIILNKNLGQNYLIDDFKRKKIIEFAKLTKEDTVLEIGPGIGTLTIELAKKAGKVIAIEQDTTIFNILKKRLEKEQIDNVELINGDAVKVDFPEFNKIVSNLPYQISSPISFKFLKRDFDLAILMYQKEFADRMNGKVGTRQYSRLSAMLYFKADVKFLTKVSPESFIPSPKVDSSVVELKPKENKISDDDFKIYAKVVKALFQHRNKKAKNALIDSRHIIGFKDKKELKGILNNLEDENPVIKELLLERTINLSPESIMELSILLKDHINWGLNMKMGKFEIETDDLVYNPSDDTFLLAENLEIKEGQSVLEIGTGSGLVSMYASLLTDDVTATDINYNALELAEKNFKLNNIDTIKLEFGDMFEPVKDKKFDVILFNTPYLPTDSDDIINDDLNYAFDGGLDGRKVIDRFINEVSNHLNDKGIVQIIQSSLSDNDKTLDMFDRNGFVAEIAKSESFFFEKIVLINAYKI